MQAKRDTYQVITDRILAALENCSPFERPWIGPSLTMPVNAVSGHEYRGTNVLMLWLTAQEAGYERNAWATFKQWSEKGATRAAAPGLSLTAPAGPPCADAWRRASAADPRGGCR